jgi:hypothetical protein
LGRSGKRQTARRSPAAKRTSQGTTEAVSQPAGFDEIADELYGKPRTDFIAARETRAREAATAGRSELAAALRRLRRPTAAAWLANVLVRSRPRALAQLLELAAQIQGAQAQLDGTALRRLSEQRRQLVADLSNEARRLAADQGQSVNEAVIRELEQTLDAASFDPAAAAELQAARLTSALAYSGMGFPPPGGAPGPESAESQQQSAQRKSDGKHTDHTAGAREAARRSERDAREARRRADRAGAALTSAQRTLERARSALAAAESEVALRRETVWSAERALRRARAAYEAAGRGAGHGEQKP